jgi:hypothetical protein
VDRQLARALHLMILNADALRRAECAFAEVLQSEADQQHAYLARFPDGHVSLELEWLDLPAITRTVIGAYVASLSEAEF